MVGTFADDCMLMFVYGVVPGWLWCCYCCVELCSGGTLFEYQPEKYSAGSPDGCYSAAAG